MRHSNGIAQSRLRRMAVHWGPQVVVHQALLPVFDGGYKVLGWVGLDAGADSLPAWYPGVPLVVEPQRLVFKSSLSDASPEWSQVDPELLEHCYFLDPWGAIQVLVPMFPDAPSLDTAVNLAGRRIRGRAIEDVEFEPPLHRVRAFRLSARWGRSELVPVHRLPALSQSLDPAQVTLLDAKALGPPPRRPEGRLSRLVRRFVEPWLTDEPPQR